jgi:hypothetical protein
MPCGLILAAALAATAPAANPLLAEPLFAGIVAKAETLEAQARTFKGALTLDLSRFRTEVAALSAMDMQGHVTLKARGTDGDLKCILKGISEDLPVKLDQVAAATDPALRDMAVDEMIALLDDNQAVVTSPPGPATPPPADS